MNDAPTNGADREPPETKPAGPCAMVIFGAGGDLTKRLVVPALYNLAASGLLPDDFALIGIDVADLSAQQWRERLAEMMRRSATGGGDFPGRRHRHRRLDMAERADDLPAGRFRQRSDFRRTSTTVVIFV